MLNRHSVAYGGKHRLQDQKKCVFHLEGVKTKLRLYPSGKFHIPLHSTLLPSFLSSIIKEKDCGQFSFEGAKVCKQDNLFNPHRQATNKNMTINTNLSHNLHSGALSYKSNQCAHVCVWQCKSIYTPSHGGTTGKNVVWEL